MKTKRTTGHHAGKKPSVIVNDPYEKTTGTKAIYSSMTKPLYSKLYQ